MKILNTTIAVFINIAAASIAFADTDGCPQPKVVEKIVERVVTKQVPVVIREVKRTPAPKHTVYIFGHRTYVDREAKVTGQSAQLEVTYGIVPGVGYQRHTDTGMVYGVAVDGLLNPQLSIGLDL